MSSALKSIDSKLVGEVEAVSEEEMNIALIGADMGSFDPVKVRDRAKIGRFFAPDGPGYLAGCSLDDRGDVEDVKARLLAEMRATKDPRIVIAVGESLKNVLNTWVAVAGIYAKSLEMMAFGGKKRSKQQNAPQAVITGANPQIIVGSVASPTPDMES